MKKIAIAVHGGASPSYTFIRKNRLDIEAGLIAATESGHEILKKGGSALDAVEVAVRRLEDNPLFNAGTGSALNCNGEVEMDASIMSGKDLKAGAVSMVRYIRNPVSLARLVMEKTSHVLLCGYGATEFAKDCGIAEEEGSYFITPHQTETYKLLAATETKKAQLKKKLLSTVGAVALDSKGNLAAATSTGGTSNCLPGRIGDSCIIGAGCYASNKTCAVSCTGIGEYILRGVVAHTISMMVEYNMSLKDACHHVLFERKPKGETGLISINREGEIVAEFNTKIMKRAWIDVKGNLFVGINR